MTQPFARLRPSPAVTAPLPLGAAALLGVALTLAAPARAEPLQTSAGPVVATAVVTGLDEPWALEFLPDGNLLITERAGRLLRVAEGEALPVEGVPEVFDNGQGGLLDVMIPHDFAQSREVWLSYALPLDGGAATAVGKGRLSEDGTRLEGFATLYHGDATQGGRHFGSRLVEAADGTVFLTTGDRGTGPDGMESQDPMRVEGKVIHLNRDGSPATSLPGHRPGVYSLGHRNAQGATLDADGNLWLVEHGAQGGDELNRVDQGRNYGWPVISYGEDYGGGQIGEGTARDGMEQPVHYWVPSIAPSGLLIYRGEMFPEWQGDVFTGSLNQDFISRLDADAAYAEERIAGPVTGRVRDIVEAPDGAIWYLAVYDGAAYRLTPAD
ncbi:PQQ-dependent sugar dehydrogenase [Paragemmobacter ruber]|uniref:PQQ-dependent sugar dehydrogenase n=1 Tax=Paragemmobacter ruber TaxID=1985673 RepID=A0ABW9Y9A0_9RHOB|nr:PQQ-dependent sugar dehydrogenase [Rhodobacter ruber]NBE08345.1 PQQ-dependent sugar dehydrogenase [Rhodobacter ruber]